MLTVSMVESVDIAENIPTGQKIRIKTSENSGESTNQSDN